jgi:adenylate cyclase
MSLDVYIPQDRRSALARGTTLPEHASGAVLFADVSGFTALTEALDRTLGSRRGAEVLTRQINAVYDALIAEVDRFGGSVISFAGDAITCWFAGVPAPARACACALALQIAMQAFAVIPLPDGDTSTLELKVVITSGSTRRFLVGDPTIQLLDALAGAPLARLAVGEQLAVRGEVLIDAPTAAAISAPAQIGLWRIAPETGERFAVLHALPKPVAPQPLSGLDRRLQDDVVQPWLLPAVYEHHQAGLGAFLTELRPAVVLFLRFSGIDFEGDPNAGAKLAAFIRRVQAILARYEGVLLQLTIGDKGNYLYAGFGAPVAHEDDAVRAARTAMDWRALPLELPFLQPLHVGISRGVLRVGAYGGISRRTYGVLGDEVNVAARLMQHAAPGEILISGRVQQALAAFDLEPIGPISLKGMPEALPVFRLRGERERPVRLTEPVYALPIIGRRTELDLLSEKLDLALAGHGQIVGITADAGMGKSRLVAEVIRLARQRVMRCFGGACQSYGTNTPYLVWGSVWRAFFDLDPSWPLRKQARMLEGTLEELAPERVEALPLLGPLLDLPLEENTFTRLLEPELRQSTLHALLLDCLCAAARSAADDGSGLLFVLEDLHWIDAASHDVLERIAQAIPDLPVLIVLAYRPPDPVRLQTPRIEALSHFRHIALGPLTTAEVEQVIRAKLAQLLPERKGVVTSALIARISERAQGNPFYVEELLNYLRDRGIDPQDTAAIESLDLPASLHSLILSRIDQLRSRQQAELKVASVIGRLFRFAWLHGAYPTLGDLAPLKADLDELARLELTPLDTPDPELAYLFKHIVTQEVAYDSLTAAARATLHEQLALYLEQLAGGATERYLDLLAYHYDRSDNLVKRREYLWRAGQAAGQRFANDAALDYLSRALELTPATDALARYDLLMAREEVYDRQGVRGAQAQDLDALEALAALLDDDIRRAEIGVRRALFAYRTGDLAGAVRLAAQAATLAEIVGAEAITLRAYGRWAWALVYQGEYEAARIQAETSLRLARALSDRQGEATALTLLGVAADSLGDYAGARIVYEQALAIQREIGDRRGEGSTLGNLGQLAWFQGQYVQSQAYAEQSLRIYREVGDQRGEALALCDLADAALIQGDVLTARSSYEHSRQIAQAIGDRVLEGTTLTNLGESYRLLGDYATAQAYYQQSVQLHREIGSRTGEGETLSYLGLAAESQGDNTAACTYAQEALGITRAIGYQTGEALAQTVLGHALIGLGRSDELAAAYQSALNLRRALGQPHLSTEPLAGLARAGLAGGDIDGALRYVEEILAHLDYATLDGAYEPLRVYLTCYQTLSQAHDPRAASILETAYTMLQVRAAKIPDEAARRMFLENVPSHREVRALWAAQHADVVLSPPGTRVIDADGT